MFKFLLFLILLSHCLTQKQCKLIHRTTQNGGINSDQSLQKDHPILNCNSGRRILQIGSSTVFPIAEKHSRQYANPMISPQALSTGSSLGFENFFAGGSDISTASRFLRSKDYSDSDCNPGDVVQFQGGTRAVNECQGRLPKGILVGRDKLAIIVKKDVPFWPDNLEFSLVWTLFQEQPDQQTDLDAITGFNGAPENIKPKLFIPDAKSGTRDFFEEIIGIKYQSTKGYVSDEELIARLMDEPTGNGIGVVPLPRAEENAGIKIMKIDDVDPGDRNGTEEYKFSRPLFMYYDKEQRDKSAIIDYMCALLTPQGQQLVEDEGYLKLTEEEVNNSTEELLCQDRSTPKEEVVKECLSGVMAEAATCRTVKRFVLAGSSTVFPISVEVARLYTLPKGYYSGYIDPRSTGSTIGFENLIAGAVPITGTSRTLKGSDYTLFGCNSEDVVSDKNNAREVTQDCQGVQPRGVKIGHDMPAVIVNSGNPVDSLTLEQLKKLITKKISWADRVFPQVKSFNSISQNATLFIPDKLSATREIFEEVLEEDDFLKGVKGFANDLEIVEQVSKNLNSIGFVGFAYVENIPSVKILKIDGISPRDVENVENATSYAFFRSLYYYYDKGPQAMLKGDVEELLCWVLGDLGQRIVKKVGYIPLAMVDPKELKKEREALRCRNF